VSVVAPRPPYAPVRGLAGAVVDTDHKAVAARTFVTAFGFFLAGGAIALLMRWELAAPGMQVTSRAGYDELFSMHGSTMIYLFVTPVALALGMYFVPLQVGAAQIAGPRVNLVAYWLLVFGGVLATVRRRPHGRPSSRCPTRRTRRGRAWICGSRGS
jgi:cytochrome c oxidase subunit 1